MAAKTVEEKLEATRRKHARDVSRTERQLAEARTEFAAASLDYQDACDGGDDEARSAAYNRCMRALGLQDGYERRLRTLTDPRELERRLENSERLARRFS